MRLPPPPPLQALPSVRLRSDRPRQPELLRQLNERQRQPSSQEMDILEQQVMSKSQPQVKEELKGLYSWLVNYVPKPIKKKADRVCKHSRIGPWGCIRGLRVKKTFRRT